MGQQFQSRGIFAFVGVLLSVLGGSVCWFFPVPHPHVALMLSGRKAHLVALQHVGLLARALVRQNILTGEEFYVLGGKDILYS